MSYKQEELAAKTMVELYRIARELEIAGYSKLRKAELVFEIQKKSTMKDREGQLWSSGILDIMAEGCKKVCCSEMGTLLAERV